MTTTGLDILDDAIAEANRWVQEVMEDLKDTNRHRAYSVLRSVLHAIRDYLTFRDTMDLAAGLPPVLRGFFLDGWKPTEGPSKEPTREAFLTRVAERLIEIPDFQPDQAAQAVFSLLSRRIDEGRIADFRVVWAQPLKGFWPRAEAVTSARGPSEAEQQARVEKTKKEIQAAIEGARQEGVPEEDLPALTPEKRIRPTRPEGRRRLKREGGDVMTTTGLDVFDKAVQKTNLWIKALMKLLAWEDRHRTFKALQAVLHGLRDRLMEDEAFQLGSQLPVILRGFYFEGWDPDQTPTSERTKDEFIGRVREMLADFPDVQPEPVTRAVFMLLARRVTEGELEDIRGRLPEPIRKLWPEERAPVRQATLGGKPPPSFSGRSGDGRRARARKARKEIRSAIARARAQGVRDQDLPVIVSRKAIRKTQQRKEQRGRKAASEQKLPPWYGREQEERIPEGESGE